jgi:integrase
VAVLGRFFGFCTDKGWLEVNPAIRLPKPVSEVKRERVLSRTELGEAWNALQEALRGEGAMPIVYPRVLALLAVTGCRASEITGLRRKSVDLDNGTIEIVAGKTAASNRILPVGPTARALLVKAIEAMGESPAPDALLFPMPRAGGVIDSYDISKAARVLVADLKHRRWTPHDLRRTLVTQAHELGIDGDVVRRIAGHVGVDVHAAVYDRSRQLDKVRDALAQYEAFVLACAAGVEQKESNVVSLRAG